MKIVIFAVDFAAEKRCRAPQTLHVSRSGHQMIVGGFCASHACIVRRKRADFQIFARKIARNSTANLRKFAAERAQTARNTRPEAMHLACTVCGTILRVLHNF